MPHASLLVDRLLLRQPRPIDRSLPGIRIDRKVSHLKGGQILKEVTSLRRRNAKIAGQPQLAGPTAANLRG